MLKPVEIYVLLHFTNGLDGYTCAILIFSRPGKIFYITAEHYKAVLKLLLRTLKVVNLKEDGHWIETVSKLSLHSKEFGVDSQ